MPYNLHMEFGKRIKELRTEKNMTQKQLADCFHIHQTTVKDWEARGKQPNYETLAELAKFFEVTADYLLGLED